MPTRAVLADDAHQMRLVVYRGNEIAAVVPLDAVRAIGLAGRLIEAAERRLSSSLPRPPEPA